MHSADIVRTAARRPEVLLGASAILMAVAGLLIWSNVRSAIMLPLRRGPDRGAIQPLPVEAVTAAHAIRRGEMIARTDLAMRGLIGMAPPHVLTSMDAAAAHVALGDFAEGQLLFSESVSPDIGAAGIAPLVPDGERAYAVRVAEEDIAGGFVRPGDHVDVFATLPGSAYAQMSAGAESDRSKGALLLQNVAVLALGSSLAGEKGDKIAADARTVTLALAPPALARLALAARLGRIALAIRNPEDHTLVAQAQAELSDLVPVSKEEAAGAVPARAVAESRPIPPGHGIVFYSGAVKSTLAVAP